MLYRIEVYALDYERKLNDTKPLEIRYTIFAEVGAPIKELIRACEDGTKGVVTSILVYRLGTTMGDGLIYNIGPIPETTPILAWKVVPNV